MGSKFAKVCRGPYKVFEEKKLTRTFHSGHNEQRHGKSPFGQDNALLASKAKIDIFEKISSGGSPKGNLE